jgi:DUF1009 family protein
VERTLALMAGAGVLPARAAAEAARQGWRVVAFAFDDTPGLAAAAAEVVPAGLDDIQQVIAQLMARGATAALFVGTFAKQRVLEHAQRVEEPDETTQVLAQRGLSDAALGGMAVMALSAIGVEVLDQRRFLGPWMMPAGHLAGPVPTSSLEGEMRDGWKLARLLAAEGIGQTIVRAFGVTVAVEAAEGTDETVRRGTRLAGPGAVVVKAVAPGNDYRFDTPSIGPSTLAALAAGRAAALAVEADRVLVVDREAVVRAAGEAGITLVGLDGEP